MENRVIYDAQWIISADPDKKSAIERVAAYNAALIGFLLSAGLLVDSGRWEGFSDWEDFRLTTGDLSAEGYELVRRCHDKWLRSIDSGKKNPAEMASWIRELKKMRGD